MPQPKEQPNMTRLVTFVDPADAAAFKRLAESGERTVAGELRRLVRQALKERGGDG